MAFRLLSSAHCDFFKRRILSRSRIQPRTRKSYGKYKTKSVIFKNPIKQVVAQVRPALKRSSFLLPLGLISASSALYAVKDNFIQKFGVLCQNSQLYESICKHEDESENFTENVNQNRDRETDESDDYSNKTEDDGNEVKSLCFHSNDTNDTNADYLNEQVATPNLNQELACCANNSEPDTCPELQLVDEDGLKYERFDWDIIEDLVSPDTKYLITVIASSVMLGILSVGIPIVMSEAFGIILDSKNDNHKLLTDLRLPGIKICLILLTQTAASIIYSVSKTKLRERMYYRLTTNLLDTILKQDMSFFDIRQTGEFISRLTSESEILINSFTMCVSYGVFLSVEAISSVVLMFSSSSKLTTAIMVALPVILVTEKFLSQELNQIFREADILTEKAMATAGEAIGSIRNIRVHALEDIQYQKFDDNMLLGSEMKQKFCLGLSLNNCLSTLALNAVLCCIGYYGVVMVTNNELTPKNMVAFTMACQIFRKTLNNLNSVFESYAEGQISGARVFEYFHRHPKQVIKGGDVIPLSDLCGDIEFKNIRFKYNCPPGTPVFKNFSFKIPKNKTVAICGTSGGGKSTLAKLLVRFYDVDEGSILIDGRDVRTLDPSWVRGHLIGYVMQDPVLFSTSVMENIRCGRPDATDEEVINASKLANADEFIRTFPEGYNTVMGERGHTVSGGQRQRIAIARALVKDPCVLILDEVTSAMDSESEKIILDTLRKVSEGRTVLILTHCGTPLSNVDLITTIDHGLLVESGTHSELLEKKGYYFTGLKQRIDNNTSTLEAPHKLDEHEPQKKSEEAILDVDKPHY